MGPMLRTVVMFGCQTAGLAEGVAAPRPFLRTLQQLTNVPSSYRPAGLPAAVRTEMETRPPTLTRILVAAGFALSCFALALFLWIAFGGPIPLKPEGYRFRSRSTRRPSSRRSRTCGSPASRSAR